VDRKFFIKHDFALQSSTRCTKTLDQCWAVKIKKSCKITAFQRWGFKGLPNCWFFTATREHLDALRLIVFCLVILLEQLKWLKSAADLLAAISVSHLQRAQLQKDSVKIQSSEKGIFTEKRKNREPNHPCQKRSVKEKEPLSRRKERLKRQPWWWK